MANFGKTLDILSKSRFIQATVQNNQISKVKFLPLGSALLENIRKEWHNSKEVQSSYSANKEDTAFDTSDKYSFLKSKCLRENVLHLKKNHKQQLPIVIKSEIQYQNNDATSQTIHIPSGTILATNFFFNPSMALEKFYHIQRERKIRWMKYSSNPSRYYLSDMLTEEKGLHKLQSLKIKSKFNDADVVVEEIHFVPLSAMNLKNESDFYMIDSRLKKSVLPTCIRSEIKLEVATCALLLDAIEENKANSLSLNRKLAPFQCGILSHFEDSSLRGDLSDLSAHISNVVRKVGISSLNLEKFQTNRLKSLNLELSELDSIGVPYCILLEPETLHTGLMKLRSRDTTLSEIIHITDVSNYLQKIFNS